MSSTPLITLDEYLAGPRPCRVRALGTFCIEPADYYTTISDDKSQLPLDLTVRLDFGLIERTGELDELLGEINRGRPIACMPLPLPEPGILLEAREELVGMIHTQLLDITFLMLGEVEPPPFDVWTLWDRDIEACLSDVSPERLQRHREMCLKNPQPCWTKSRK